MNTFENSTLEKFKKILSNKNYSIRTIEMYSGYVLKFYKTLKKDVYTLIISDLIDYLYNFKKNLTLLKMNGCNKETTHNDCPSNSFKYGKPSGTCWSDGHYICNNCKNLKPEFVNKENLDKAYHAQGGLQIWTLMSSLNINNE
jgi:hypothetical protein